MSARRSQSQSSTPVPAAQPDAAAAPTESVPPVSGEAGAPADAAAAQDTPPAAAPEAAPPAKAKAAAILVRAIAQGFYNGARRRIGDVFPLVKPAHFSKTWMAPAEDKAAEEMAAAADRRLRANAQARENRPKRLKPNGADLVDEDAAAPAGAADRLKDVI